MTATLNKHFRHFQPRERIGHLAWARKHARNTDGRPYSHDLFPHMGNPGGPCDALDDPRTRKVSMMMGSRLGKSYLSQAATMRKADVNPGPMMFVSATEKNASEVVERTYKMIAASPRIAGQLRREGLRRRSCIDFAACQCFVGWARSVSTLADKEVEFLHANEIDKWEHESTSKEADPLKLALDRLKNRPHHKAILESTPTVKGKSRIESLLLTGTNCRYYVPCPHCGHYQRLVMDRIKWDKLENGKSDKGLARKSAHYLCEACDGRIDDHHRPTMMRRGVWCPEGCKVDGVKAREVVDKFYRTIKGGDGASADDGYKWLGWGNAGWVEGSSVRDDVEASYQLSSLYALSLTWGDIAAEWVSCQGKPQDLRNFVNQWLAETWEVVHRKTTWEDLADRTIIEVQSCVVPIGFSFLTAGVDRQQDHFVYVIDAWGEGRKSHTVDYGQCETFDQLADRIIRPNFRHQDGGPSLKVRLTLIDSGFHPKDIYEFCRTWCKSGSIVWPCKGSNATLDAPYREGKLGKDTHMPGAPIVHVDTLTSQDWLSNQLLLPRGSDGAMTIFKGSLLEHRDYLEQLLNDAAILKLGSNNNEREVWERIDESTPNDYRDCRRYGYVAMLRATRGAPIRPRVAPS